MSHTHDFLYGWTYLALTIDRPEHLNCFSEEMIHLWTAALEDIRDRDDIYAVLLSGNGKAFCAGGDVKAMAAGDGFFESHDDITSTALARKNSLWKGIQRIPLILEEIDRPVVAKIHGPAVGAGLDMALMCDVRIAAESASMSSYFNAGIVPGDGGAYFLPRLVGRDRALDMFWTARTVKGEEAERMGLVTRVVPDGELDQFVEEYMQKLLEAPQQAMRLTKRAIHESEQSTLRASLDMVSSFMGIVTELDDYRTRTAALVEKLEKKHKRKKKGVVRVLGAAVPGVQVRTPAPAAYPKVRSICCRARCPHRAVPRRPGVPPQRNSGGTSGLSTRGRRPRRPAGAHCAPLQLKRIRVHSWDRSPHPSRPSVVPPSYPLCRCDIHPYPLFGLRPFPLIGESAPWRKAWSGRPRCAPLLVKRNIPWRAADSRPYKY